MSRILLCAIHSQYIHTSPALGSLSRYAGCRGLRMGLAEYNVNQPVDQILQDLYGKKPDILGFSCYLWNIGIVEGLVKELKLLRPSLKVFLGGPEVSFDPMDTLSRIPADYIVAGEGERRVYLLLRDLTEGKTPRKIDGVFSPSGGILAAYEDPQLSLDETAFAPPADLAPDPTRILYYESSRGCPYRCSYCLSCLSHGVRARSLDLVKQDLNRFLQKAPPQVKFIDRTFNYDQDRAVGIWQFLIEHDNGITNFHFEINGDLITPEQLDLLSRARSGLFQFEIGLQSTNQETLTAIGRRNRFETLKKNLLALRQQENIHLHLDLIAGLPYESYARFGQSFDDAFSCRPHMLQLGFLKVLKGTKLAQDCSRYGIRFRSRPPYEVLDTQWITFSELCQLKGIEELVDHYWNSGHYPVSLPFLLEKSVSPFLFFERFWKFQTSDWDEKKDLAQRLRPQTLEQRRERLLAFTRTLGIASESLLKDLLLADCYAKSMPTKIPASLGLFSQKPQEQAIQSRRVAEFFRQGRAAEYFPFLQGMDRRTLHQKAQIVCFSHDLSQPGFPAGDTAFLYQYVQKDDRGFAGIARLKDWFSQTSSSCLV